jgi:NADPH-dependent curcumin reductase
MRCSLRDRGRPPGWLDLQRLHHNHILDAALARLAMRGRVVLCGGIANYNATEPPPGRKNYLNLIVQRGRMEGFIILDYMPRAAEAIGALAGWLDEGKLKTKVDTQHGLENARETLRRLFEGRNEGKQLLRSRTNSSLRSPVS